MTPYNTLWKYDMKPINKTSSEYIFIKTIVEKGRCETSQCAFECKYLHIYKIKDNTLDTF